jgi:PAS domain S-box-containing protein
MFSWQNLSLLERIRRLRYILPPMLVLLVVLYQLGVARYLEQAYGHTIHYSVEIAFYSLAGPVVTWLTLVWVESRLAEKEALEGQVRAREQHLATLTAASADAILSLDRRGRITSWNRGAERLFGFADSEIVGQALKELLPDATTLAQTLQRDGVVQNFETIALTKDGSSITVDLTQTLLTDSTPNNLTSSLIMRDITTRRERAAIVEEERARIARDLHDSVAQILYLLALKADMAAEQIADKPGQVQADLKEIGQRCRQVIREIRRTIFALRPLDWSQGEFLPALRRFVKDFAEHLNWQASFQPAEDSLAIPERLQPTVFRLVQESLNNAAKHAEATRVWVEISQVDETPYLALRVRDNGIGFDPSTPSDSGLGLRQMQHRVEVMGGTFNITSQKGSGTTITSQMPL